MKLRRSFLLVLLSSPCFAGTGIPKNFQTVCGWETPLKAQIEKMLEGGRDDLIEDANLPKDSKLFIGTPMLSGNVKGEEVLKEGFSKMTLADLAHVNRIDYPVFSDGKEWIVGEITAPASVEKGVVKLEKGDAFVRRAGVLTKQTFDLFYEVPEGLPKSICDYRRAMVPWRSGESGGRLGFLYFSEKKSESMLSIQVFKTPDLEWKTRVPRPSPHFLGPIHDMAVEE